MKYFSLMGVVLLGWGGNGYVLAASPSWPSLHFPPNAHILQVAEVLEWMGKPVRAQMVDVPLTFEETLETLLPSIPASTIVQEVPMGLFFSGIHQQSMWLLQMHAVEAQRTQLLLSALTLEDISSRAVYQVPRWWPSGSHLLHASRTEQQGQQQYYWMIEMAGRQLDEPLRLMAYFLEGQGWRLKGKSPFYRWERPSATLWIHASLGVHPGQVLLWMTCTEPKGQQRCINA